MNQKQLKLLNEIKVKMFYDPSKTLSEQTAFERQLDRTFSTPEGAENFLKTFQPYRHEIIQLAAFGLMFIPYVGPVISTSLELADAALYASEGDKYMAGLSAALSMIGLPLWPGAKKYTKDFILKTIKKSRLNSRLTKEESEVPHLLDKINLEWLWRLHTDTLRRFKRLLETAFFYIIYKFHIKSIKFEFVK